MPKELPEFTFKKHIRGERISLITKEDLERVMNKIINEAMANVRREDVVLLTMTIYLESASYEFRCWITDTIARIVTNIDEGYSPSDIYELYYEILLTSREAAEFDIERAKLMGFEIVETPRELLNKVIYKILGLSKGDIVSKPEVVVMSGQAHMGSEDTGTRPETILRKPKSLKVVSRLEVPVEKESDPLNVCITALVIVEECGDYDDPRESLQKCGAAIIGESNEYSCVLAAGSKECPYVVAKLSRSDSWVTCIDNIEEIV